MYVTIILKQNSRFVFLIKNFEKPLNSNFKFLYKPHGQNVFSHGQNFFNDMNNKWCEGGNVFLHTVKIFLVI